MPQNTLIVLPSALFNAANVHTTLVHHKIYNIVFWEHPHWFTDSIKTIFYRAAMKNTYEEYYDQFHDETTTFHYIEFDDPFDAKTLLIGKIYVFEPADFVDVRQMLTGFDFRVIGTDFAFLGKQVKKPESIDDVSIDPVERFSHHTSRVSEYRWLEAYNYARDKGLYKGDLPPYEATFWPDIKMNIKRILKREKNSPIPWFLTWLIEAGMIDPAMLIKGKSSEIEQYLMLREYKHNGLK